MAKQLDKLTDKLQDFIERQKIFFVGTAMTTGRVNVSPKGMDSFRVVNPNRIVWLNLTGSGNETAIHLSESDRMTIMFCSFEKNPLILRLYGTAKARHAKDDEYQEYIGLFPETPGSRQIMVMDVDMVQTSCGYAVPFMEFKEERTVLTAFAQKRGEEGLKEYRKEKNSVSIDGHKTTEFE